MQCTIYYNIILYIAMSSRFLLYWIFLQRDADNGSAATERGRDDHNIILFAIVVVVALSAASVKWGKKNINNNEKKKER